ncbi:Gfo/Idh/MocA family oxidoreductase [Rugosimonospora acidiphila]|uniref:Gfo/Idh/MocA family oxidoreductase n=1 Tax=Rugosimonospora acidiphila TaxID=556531 RepID=A0ABP9SGN0_9ACTN
MTLRFGLLGTGHWAAETQAAGLDGHPEIEFVGVWGRDPVKAEALASRYRVRSFADVDELIGAVDAVAMALPPDVQAPLAIRAAEAGRHLLLDKPVALDLDQADRLVQAVTGAGVASLVFVTNRYRPNVQAFVDGAVATGGWSGAQVTFLNSIFGADSPYAGSSWRRRWGGLWDFAPHPLSVLLPVLGPVVEVTAAHAPHDTVHAILRHADAVSTLTVSVNAPPAVSIYETVLFGEAGVARMPEPEGESVDAFRAAASRLVGNVAAGVRTDPLDVRAGRDTVAVLAAVQASADGGGAPQGVRY